MNFKNLAIVYLLCSLMALGHWFANEYEAEGDTLTTGNPVTGLVVAMVWPSYVSYLVFKDN